METYQNVSYHHHHHHQQQQQQESSQFLCDQQTMSTSCSSSSSLDEKSLISASSTTSFVPIATQQPEDPEQVAPSGRQGRRESSLMCENLEQPETSFELGSPTTTSGTDAKPTEQTPASQPDGKDQPGEAVSKQTDTNNNTSDYPDQHYGYQNEQYSGQWTASDQYGQQVSGANNQYFNANSPLRESTNTRQDCHDKPAGEPQQQMVDANNNHQYNSYCYQPEAARYQSYQHYDQGQQQQHQHQHQHQHQQQQHQHQPTQNVALYDVGGHVIEYRPVAEQAELSQQPAQLDYYDNQAAYPCYSGLEPPSSFYSDVVVDPNNNNHHHHQHQQQHHYHQQHDYYQHQDTSHMLHPLEQENDSCKTYTSLERSSRTRDLLADPYNLGSGSSSAPAHVVHHIPAAVDGNEAMEVGDWAEWLPSGEPYQPSSSSSSSAYHNQQVPVVSQSYDPSAELNWNLDANLAQEDSNANEFAGWSGDSNRDEEEEEEEEADEDEEAEEEEYEEEEEEEDDDDDDDESMVSSCPGERAKRRARKRAASVAKNSHRPNQTALTNPLGRPRGCSRSTLQKLRAFLLTRMPRRPTSSHPGGTSMLLCKKSPAAVAAAAAEVKVAQTIHQTDNSRSKPAELKMAASLQGSPVIVRGPNSSNEPTGVSRKRPAEETTDSEEAGVIADNRQLRNRTIIISSRGSSQGGSHRSPSLSATSTPHNEEEPLEEQDDNDHEDEPGQATCSGVQTRARKRQRQIERETRQTRLSCSSLSSTPPWSSSLCSTSSSRCRRGRSSSSTSSSFLPAVEISMDCN